MRAIFSNCKKYYPKKKKAPQYQPDIVQGQVKKKKLGRVKICESKKEYNLQRNQRRIYIRLKNHMTIP
jgi:hypothetical protein